MYHFYVYCAMLNSSYAFVAQPCVASLELNDLDDKSPRQSESWCNYLVHRQVSVRPLAG